MKDRMTIINGLVNDAADIMEMHMEREKIIIELRREKYGPDDETSNILEQRGVDTVKAIELMRSNSGCWA